MSTSYPSGVDTFTEPSLPEETPLSSAGSATRNHVEHHRDLGDAIEALQVHAAQKTHNHDGTDSPTGGPKLKQEHTHEDVDTDTSPQAIHHTLGPGPTQAAPGDHNHDYNNLLHLPLKICTSSTRPALPDEGMIIYETDTRIFRQWSMHQDALLVHGINSHITFPPNSTTIGGGGWEIAYNTNEPNTGFMATPGGMLRWIDQGNWTKWGWAYRTDPADAKTLTDDQIITWKVGEVVVENVLIFTDAATNDFYFRVSDDRQSYLRLRIGTGWLALYYTTAGRDEEVRLGLIEGINTQVPNSIWMATLVGNTMTIYRQGEAIAMIVDTRLLSSKGPEFRGWGLGMQAGTRYLGQTTPSEIEWVRIQDLAYYESTTRWSILPIGNIPIVRLQQGKAQRLSAFGSILEFTEEIEDTFGFFNKNASQTDVVIKEPGLYDIYATIQWDTQLVPDEAHAVIMLNGQDTYIRDSKYLRGSGIEPGFSQTLCLTGCMRLAVNDIVQLKAKFKSPPDIINQIFSAFDPASRVSSRLELVYRSP